MSHDDFLLSPQERQMRRTRRRRRIIWIGAVVLLVGFAVLVARPVRNEIKGWQARRHAQKAFALIEQEKWNDARTEALAAYQLRQTEPQALRAVARLLSRIRQAQAFEFWDQLAQRQPLTREDLRDEAAVALSSGEAARAERAIASLLARPDAGPPDYLLAAQLDLQQGERAEAEANLEKMLASPDATERERLQATIAQLALAEAGKDEAARKSALELLHLLSQSKSETGLNALMIRAQSVLGGTGQSEVGSQKSEGGDQRSEVGSQDLVHALETHPLAKAPQKLLALDLIAHHDPAQRDALIERALGEWKNGDTEALTTLGAWLNRKGEHQKVLDNIPLEKAFLSREVFLQYVDALGALERWRDIEQLLNGERDPIEEFVQRMYLARCNAQLGEKTAEENNWRRALESAGGDPQKLLPLADYAGKNGALEIADAAYAGAAAAVPNLRPAHQGRLRLAQAARDTKRMHAILAEMLKVWPKDTAIQNDEAYTRLLLMSEVGEQKSEVGSQRSAVGDQTSGEPTSGLRPLTSDLEELGRLAETLVEREPASLPHRTLLALARLKQNKHAAALEVYANIQTPTRALTPSALAVHAAVLAANGHFDDARTELQQIPPDSLLPEEKALIAHL